MARLQRLLVVVGICSVFAATHGIVFGQDAPLPKGVKAVWDMSKAHRETTPTRERICINGLWRWQPVPSRAEGPVEETADAVPGDNWGYFKVPGPWPKTRWSRAGESQRHYPHPSWKDVDLSKVEMAWYQREVVIPKEWTGRRIVVDAQYVHTSAVFYLDGKRAGEIKSRGGKVDLTALCLPGKKQLLSVLVHHPKTRKSRDFRGLCGDVYLDGVPMGERIDDVKINTSVRKWRISADTAVLSLNPDKQYILRGEILDKDEVVKTITSKPFRADDIQNGRITFSNPWQPKKLWDTHTPENQYDLKLRLLDADGKVLDEFRNIRFGFREIWIDGRDIRLNGTKIFFFATALDVAEVSAYGASYKGTRKMVSRFKSVGVNIAYTHNYVTTPGSHMSFEEVMKACNDSGMLIALSMPNFKSYKYGGPDEGWVNQCAEDVEFYVRRAQNHPSVAMYWPTGKAAYNQSQNPDQLDGIVNPYPDPEGKLHRGDLRGIAALKIEAMIQRLDNSRLITHHHSCNMPQAYTANFYLNFVPIQERSDWFEHWATKSVKPLIMAEYGPPLTFTWAMSRHDLGKRRNLWFYAEWGAQYRGDAAYHLAEITENKKRRKNKNVDSVKAMHIAENWPAFRTWGISLFNNFNLHYSIFTARKGATNPPLTVDWDNLQKPGFSPDFLRTRRWDIGYQDSDWTPNREGEVLIRYNQPLLAYIAGKPERFTSRDHNFNPGETVRKQIIVINNSRRTVQADCSWSLELPNVLTGNKKVSIETGEQVRIPIRFALPKTLKAGQYNLTMTTKLNTDEIQKDTFTIDVTAKVPKPRVSAKVALFDPKGESKKLLSKMGVKYKSVKADANLADYDILVIGKHALTSTGSKLDLSRVRTGLKVIVFEQTYNVLEGRFGFRAQEYGLRDVFARVAPDSPILAGLTGANLHDWRGEGTTVGPRLDDPIKDPRKYAYGPPWCGFPARRAWRCGCQGTVASVLIEKPTAGDFLPLLDGGFSLQYAPLMEYREGSGMMLFCQLDVTGRTERDPAAQRLVSNLLSYVSAWKPSPKRTVVYVGESAGKKHLESAGLSVEEYKGGALKTDQVLVVGPGGGKSLADHSAAVKSWLAKGGHLLAVGLDGDEINAFLPFKVTTKKADYLSSYFEPAGMSSLLAGIGSADTYNRKARSVALLTGGAVVLGDGVLAETEGMKVVFCQLVPWRFDHVKTYNVKPTFRRSSFALTRLLGNMGVRADTSLLNNMQNPLPARALREGVPNVVWLETAESELILPKVWKGLPVGAAEPPKNWERTGFDDGKWRDIKVPGTWEDQFKDLFGLDGLFLYRVAFEVPAKMAGQDVTLVLGAVDDEDWTYVNGKLVGSITKKTNPGNYYAAVRRYKLPKGTLKAGRNVISVKVNDLRQAGGMKASDMSRNAAGIQRWLSGLYLDVPERLDDPYRYYRW